jgi:ribosomal protein L34E
MFKEFIQTYPFAARLEQLRNESASSAEIDLDKDENIDEAKFETSKQPVASSPVCLTPQSPLHVTFSSLIAQSSAGKSTESVSPLVEYLKDMALNEIGKAKTNVPSKSQKPAKKANKKAKESKNVVNNQSKNPQIKSSDTSKQVPKQVKLKVVKGSTVDSQPKPKQLNASSTKKPQVQSNVQPIENAPQIKGVPKILARKAVITTDSNATVAEPVAEIPKKPARIVKREPYIPPVEPIHNEAKSQPGNVSEKREPYIRPGEITSLPSNKTVTNVSNKPSKNTKVFKTNVQLELISEPSDIKPEQIKKPAKQKKKPKAPVGDGVKTDVVPSETTPIVKRIFTSKAKQQLEKEKQQDPK